MLDKGTGKKTWLERGIGEVKLLKYVRRIKFNFCVASFSFLVFFLPILSVLLYRIWSCD
jgi:hypothetical protein